MGILNKFTTGLKKVYDKQNFQERIQRNPNKQLVQAVASVGNVRPYRNTGRGNGRGNSGYGRRGRPKGAYDSRYAQFGGVYGYRKFMAQQRRLALLKAQAGMQQQMQQNPQEVLENYQEYQQPQYQQPQQYPQQPYQQQPQYPQQPYPQPQQASPQSIGPKLWDHSFMKMNKPVSNNPNANPMLDALNPQTPSGEPGGNYYTEPDFFSGKQVLKRRSGDKLFKW